MLAPIFPDRYLAAVEDFSKIVEQLVQQKLSVGLSLGMGEGTAYREAMAEVLAEARRIRDAAHAREEAHCPPGQAKDGRLTLSVGVLLDKPGGNRMKKLRRRHLLDGVRNNVVYIVKDGDAVLYVGCTRFDPSGRLSEHVAARTALGQAIRNTRPRSNEWSVDLISHADHKAALQTEMELTVQYKPRYCAVYANAGETKDVSSSRAGNTSPDSQLTEVH